jgi:hypothetical protein
MPSAFELQPSIEKLKQNTNKSSGTDQIPAELNNQVAEKFALRSINLLTRF